MKLSSFTEYIKRKIKVRMTILEVICGIDENLKELPRNGNSLYAKLKSLGIRLKQGVEFPMVDFNQLEHGLILFRNSNPDTL